MNKIYDSFGVKKIIWLVTLLFFSLSTLNLAISSVSGSF